MLTLETPAEGVIALEADGHDLTLTVESNGFCIVATDDRLRHRRRAFLASLPANERRAVRELFVDSIQFDIPSDVAARWAGELASVRLAGE